MVPKPPIAYFRLDDPDYMRPVIPQIISSSTAGILSGGVPLIILLILELLFFWDKWNVYHLVTGHATSVGEWSDYVEDLDALLNLIITVLIY